MSPWSGTLTLMLVDPPGRSVNPYVVGSECRVAPPDARDGQQVGQGPGPRYLWPRLQVFEPPGERDP